MHYKRNWRHGDPLKTKTEQHGGSYSFEYGCWTNMRYRCTNKNKAGYKDYGGRGISFCNNWSSFSSFLSDMGPAPSKKHSIDRIDTNGNYEPSNCHWATSSEQMNNTRTNRYITYNKKTMTATAWAKEIGIIPNTLFGRLHRGWSIEKTLTTIPQTRRFPP